MATTRRPPKTSSQPPQNSGLAGASGPIHGATKLGVPPPPKAVQSARMAAAKPPTESGGRTWIIFGAILAILAGIGLALVLMR